MKNTSEPVLVTMSVLAGLQLFFGGMGATGVGQSNVVLTAIGAFGTLAVAAGQFGIQYYVRGQVTANVNVVARETAEGSIVAGQASSVDDGELVDVVAAEEN